MASVTRPPVCPCLWSTPTSDLDHIWLTECDLDLKYELVTGHNPSSSEEIRSFGEGSDIGQYIIVVARALPFLYEGLESESLF